MKKLMVVDDEFIVRIGIRSMMNWEDHGYTIAADASCGEDAMEKIARYRPDIVLTDLKMENGDGFELIRRCGEEYPGIRFVVLSSYNDFDNVRKAMKLGARDYVFKLTISPEELLKTLDELDTDHSYQPLDTRQEQLGVLIRENIQAIKYNLLSKCVNPGGSNLEDVLSQFNTLALGVDLLRPYRILYVAIDDFEKLRLAGEFRDLAVIKASMENIIRELLGKLYQMETFNYEKGDVAVFINDSVEDDFARENATDEVAGYFVRIRDYIKRYLGFTVSAVISPEIRGLGDLPILMRTCTESLHHRNSTGQLCAYSGGLRNEIVRAKEFIASHPGEKLGVLETAAEVRMSESYFSHLFKRETGVNFIDYVNRIRMENAASLLENSDLKIADVANQVGMENANYFSVLFRKIMGCTPQVYRARSKNNEPNTTSSIKKNFKESS